MLQPLLQEEQNDQTSTSAPVVAKQQPAARWAPSLLSQLTKAPLRVIWSIIQGAEGMQVQQVLVHDAHRTVGCAGIHLARMQLQ